MKTLARQIVKLKQIVFSVGVHAVERIDKTRDFVPIAYHYVDYVEIAVYETSFVDFFLEDHIEFLPCPFHGIYYLIGKFAFL